MRLPSQFGRVPTVVALAGLLVVAVVGGGALANAVAGPASNADDSRVQNGPSGGTSVTAASTPTDTSPSTDSSTTETVTQTPSTVDPLQVTDTPTATVVESPADAEPAGPSGTVTPTETDRPPTEADTIQSPEELIETETTTDEPDSETPTTSEPDTATPVAEPGGSQSPDAVMCYPYPAVGAPGEPVEFRAQEPSGGEYDSYEWEFSPDSVIGEPFPPTAASGRTVTNTFPEAGVYTVSLTVTDDGQTATQTRQVAVFDTGTDFCAGPNVQGPNEQSG